MNLVEVHQITSKGNKPGQAYFNVQESFGSIAVITNVEDHVVIIVRHTLNTGYVEFITFDSEKYFEEWKKHNTLYKFERII